jgi:serine/threonine-protein kinase
MDIIGRTIANRYEIISKTGVGGMATVYVARDKVLNRDVAVKVLKDEFTTDDEFVKRFNSEAQAAASLTHANIVSIYDVGNEDGIYYIVMELVRGKTLKQIINEEGALPWKWSVNIAGQIASALEMAHKNNIVHSNYRRWSCKSNRFWNSKGSIKFNNNSIWNNYWFCTLFLTRASKRRIYRC